MTVITQPPQVVPSIPSPPPASAPCIEPTRHRWTPEEYIKMIDANLFEDRRMELIDGEIFEISSQNNPHVAGISKTTRLLVAARRRPTLKSTTCCPEL